MKIKHTEIAIPHGQPFANCKLGREPYARVLTNIVNTYAEGFVLAINNEWGAGKTTFVKMWEQQLKEDSFQTIYFNAWENDFDSNPLVALLSELKTLTKKDETKFKRLLKSGVSLTKSIIPTLVKAIADKYIDSAALKDAIDKITNDAADLFEAEVSEYASKKDGLQEFKTALTNFLAESSNGKPLVFIVDELDRCRPDYAVEVLENIKHFFSVDKIVFVLSIDKAQLKNAICGFYGTDNLDSENYLKRFIDLEYNLPDPESKQSVEYFYTYYEFDRFLKLPERVNNELRYDDTDLKLIASKLFHRYKTSLRLQEKLFAKTRLILSMFPADNFVFTDVLFFLVYLKEVDYQLFKSIENRSLNLQDFVGRVEPIFIELVDERDKRLSIATFCRTLVMYHTYYGIINSTESLYSTKDGATQTLNIKTITDESEMLQVLKSLHRLNRYRIGLNHLLEKISLTETIKVVN